MKQSLTPTERKIAIWFARGKSLDGIAAELAIAPVTLRVHLSRIRAKCGLTWLDPSLVARHLEGTKEKPHEQIRLSVTETQATILKLISQGQTCAQIATALGINNGTVMNHASKGCKRLGITATGNARTAALRAHFGPKYPPGDWRNEY